MDQPTRNEDRSGDRIAKVSLAVASVMTVATLGLALYLAWDWSREIRVEELTPGQRLKLLEQAQRISPPVYRHFLFSGNPGFYHMRPDTRYENVYGATFVTNDLGFRAVRTEPKPADRQRIVVVGDSWTFGPFVDPAAAFPAQLERMLNRAGERWQVYNLGLVGWNAANALTALRLLRPRIRPDVVVFCPTSNDADEAFRVWNGRLVTQGFTSRAVFRHSYTFEQRWVSVFKEFQAEVDRLERDGIPSLLYFLADWGSMPPYYARMADLTAPFITLPEEYLAPEYRLPAEIDPAHHATVEGNRIIATYLHNGLIEAGIVDGIEPLPFEHEVEFGSRNYDEQRVQAQLAFALGEPANLIPVDDRYMLQRGLYSVPSRPEARSVVVRMRLIDSASLYPLTVDLKLLGPETVGTRIVFEDYEPDEQTVTLAKPTTLDGYDYIEVELLASRATMPPGSGIPISLLQPQVEAQ